MPSVLRHFFVSLLLAVFGAGVASAQAFDFSLFLTSSTQNGTVANGQTITLNTEVNTQIQVTITATYTGSTTATITSMPSVIGSPEITVALVKQTVPFTLAPHQSFSFTVTYAAQNANGASIQVQIPYTEPSTSGSPISNAIVLLFNGVSPSFTLDYFLSPNNVAVPIASGGTIQFPPTQINTTATAGLQIINIGTGAGQITGITGPGSTSSFQLTNVPLITSSVPYTLPAGSTSSTLTIGILYTPTKVGTDTGQITISFQNGLIDTINLNGSGATSTYTYTYLSGTTSTSVAPKGTITLPPVTVATSGTTPATSSVIVTVKNSGNANGTINSINVVPDPPFQLSGISAAPPTLKPGDVESFTITYTPTAVGTQTGTLQVGSDTFTLSATGLGPQLTFSYVANGTTIPVPTGGAVAFTPVAISQSQKVTFTITNSGTSTAIISLISTSAPFSLTPQPALPLSLAAGQSTQFGITFTPVSTGTVTGTLVINNLTIQLVGSGNAPPGLSSYTLSGPSGNVSPASQENVSLSLAKSYPVDLDGVLTLTTSGNFGTDPAVQFSTGNRVVDFVIPAGSTSADFAGQGSQILLQTGTVAETVTLTPSFTTTAGVDVSPATLTNLEFTVPSLAPVLESVEITNESTTSFTLQIVGYSTTRSLGSLNVTFTAASGFNLATNTFTSDLSQVGALWFQSGASQAFGGLFQVTVPFNLTGSVGTGQSPLQAIASVSATISNGAGTSNSLQANIQ